MLLRLLAGFPRLLACSALTLRTETNDEDEEEDRDEPVELVELFFLSLVVLSSSKLHCFFAFFGNADRCFASAEGKKRAGCCCCCCFVTFGFVDDCTVPATMVVIMVKLISFRGQR